MGSVFLFLCVSCSILLSPSHSFTFHFRVTHSRIHTHAHTRARTHTHTRTHTCTHTQGKWKPQRISNPSYFEDEHPFESLLTIHAIGFELWTMSAGIHFDNILITSELAVANNFAREGYELSCGRRFQWDCHRISVTGRKCGWGGI